MADLNATPRARGAQSPNGRTAAEIREGLAPSKKEAQLRLVDGTPLSGWLTNEEMFDAALGEALRHHPRDAIRIQLEEPL